MELVPNPETGDVIVPVNRSGVVKEYTLKLGMNASVQLQQRRKLPLGEIVKTFATMDTESMRDVLFVLLQRHHKDDVKTLTDAGEVLEDMGPHRFFAAFTAVMKHGAAEAPKDGAKENPQMPAPILTGDSSTSTVDAPA
jgi:hypothetical protein